MFFDADSDKTKPAAYCTRSASQTEGTGLEINKNRQWQVGDDKLCVSLEFDINYDNNNSNTLGIG